jgi:hypothetical protein
MVKVERRVRVHRDGRVLEALALFDTGSRRSHLSKEFAEKVGYEPYREPKKVPLAVKPAGKVYELEVDEAKPHLLNLTQNLLGRQLRAPANTLHQPSGHASTSFKSLGLWLKIVHISLSSF